MHKALLLLKRIPKGKVVSYAALAKACETPPRAIGRIMKCNKDFRYPCYKVVHADGRVGFYSNGGAKKKIELLGKDGIKIKDGKVDRKCFWKPENF